MALYCFIARITPVPGFKYPSSLLGKALGEGAGHYNSVLSGVVFSHSPTLSNETSPRSLLLCSTNTPFSTNCLHITGNEKVVMERSPRRIYSAQSGRSWPFLECCLRQNDLSAVRKL